MDKNKFAILATGFFLVVGVFIIWFSKEYLEFEGDTLFVTLLLLPIVAYLLLSGKVKELRTPGGLEIVMGEHVSEALDPEFKTHSPMEADINGLQSFEKETMSQIDIILREIGDKDPIMMTMYLGGNRMVYSPVAVLKYLEAFSTRPNFKFVVFLGNNDEFVAYMPSRSMKELLGFGELGKEFIKIVNEGNIDGLFQYPGVVKETITIKTTYQTALQEMLDRNLNALIVTDNNRRVIGVIERDKVISRIVLSIAR